MINNNITQLLLIRRYLFVGLLLIGLTNCTSSIIVRAPIDGYVSFIAEEGDVFEGGVAKSQIMFDNIRSQIGTSRIHSKAGDEFRSQGIVANLVSDALAIQYEQELVKLNLAVRRLEATKKLFDHEVIVAPIELQARSDQRIYRQEMVSADRLRHAQSRHRCQLPNRACTGHASASRINSGGIGAARGEFNTFEMRQEYTLETDIPTRVEIAEEELKSAEYSIKLIEASVALGEISCPVDCEIVEIYALKNQFATKGDPLFRIREVSSE